MKIVVAPDKFKDCLDATAVAEAIAAGLRLFDSSIEIDLCPMADGGEGTVAALVAATGGKIVTHKVTGPLPRMKVDAPIGLLGGEQTAVIEMASASGLALLEEEHRDPTRTTTYGTGELMKAAADLGAKKIILGIGGSATVDGGVGAAQAWGERFTLISGQGYSVDDRRLSGGDLQRLLRAEGNMSFIKNALLLEDQSGGQPRSREIVPRQVPELRLDTKGVEFVVACDVGNPLLGPDGAARIFGPQKGATPEQIEALEEGLHKLVERTGCHEHANIPGAGAAGGLGFGMLVFFGATLRPGIDIVIDATRLKDRLADADLCITGEGKLDSQTLGGKTVLGVSRLCRELDVPCIALAGTIGEGAEGLLEEGVSAYHAITDGPMSLEHSMRNAAELLTRATANLIRTNLAHRQTRWPWDGDDLAE
jgi:glycerate 2-kinase